jgi:FkbM family methyltransferase
MARRGGPDSAFVRGWCAGLIAAQRNGSCVSPFTNIVASLSVPVNLNTEAYVTRVQKVSSGHAAMPTWMSGQGQDWWVWYNHARFLKRRGTYVDLAANDAIWRSNTYVFDACLGWRGLLIEPNAKHYGRIAAERKGELIQTCISNQTDSNVSFVLGGWRDGSSRIVQEIQLRDQPHEALNRLRAGEPPPSGTRQHTGNASIGRMRPRQRRSPAVQSIRCRTLASVLSDARVNHVDFLSLDVEGSEIEVLSSVDWTAAQIDIIISENPAVADMLLQAGYRYQSTLHDHVFLRGGFTLGIELAGLVPTDTPGHRKRVGGVVQPQCEQTRCFA